MPLPKGVDLPFRRPLLRCPPAMEKATMDVDVRVGSVHRHLGVESAGVLGVHRHPKIFEKLSEIGSS